jgi:hypothetical protein
MKTNASAIAALANDACGVAVIVDRVALSRPASSVLTCSRALDLPVDLHPSRSRLHLGLTKYHLKSFKRRTVQKDD